MKKRVVTSKDNKRALRWLQAAGQAKPPITIIVDLSFARAVAREAEVAPTVRNLCIPRAGGHPTQLFSSNLDVPCRLVVTAATMAASEKYRNEVQAAADEAAAKKKSSKAAAASAAAAANENNSKEDDAGQLQPKQPKQQPQQQQQQQQKNNRQVPNARLIHNPDVVSGASRPTFIQESVNVANSTRQFLKACELWSPPPSVVEDRGGFGNESRAVADAVMFGRPSMEERDVNALPQVHGVIVATHNPDTKKAILQEQAKYRARGGGNVAVCIARALSRPFSLRIDAMTDDNEAGGNNNSNCSSSFAPSSKSAAAAASSSSSSKATTGAPPPPAKLTQRAAADLMLVKRLAEQNLISTNKARFVVKSIGGTKQHQQTVAVKSNTSAGNTGASAASAVAAATGREQQDQVQPSHKILRNEKRKAEQKKKARLSPRDRANPLAKKKKKARTPLRVVQDE